MPPEDKGGGKGTNDVILGGGGPNSDDVSAIEWYLHHRSFGTDGDYTGHGGYGGDKSGPEGSKAPEKDEDWAVELLDAVTDVTGRTFEPPSRKTGQEGDLWREIEPYTGAQTPEGSLFAFVGADVDIYSGLPPGIENPDPFTDLPASDPFADAEWRTRARSAAPFATLRQNSLLSSPYLLAENDVIACDPNRASCPPNVKSDFNQSSLANLVQAEMDESNAAMQTFSEGKARIISDAEHDDIQKVVSKAAQVARSDEYKLAYTVNQLRYYPLEIRHSAVLTGLGHMAFGGITMVGSGLIIYGTGGLALPLIGATGFGAGTAETISGFTLAISGADSTETVRMSGQLDYVFALTKSPTSLMFGTTGLVLSNGDINVSHRFAVVGGIAEDLATFRGDPSKLYSAVIPSGGTKAEKGASALLVKDVAALGYTARADSIETVATKLNRDFTVADLNAIDAFREQMGSSGRLDLSGQAGHAASGAAGSGGGVDFVKYGAFAQELKLHGPDTSIQQWYLDKAWTQSLNYSIKFQLETRALGEQLVQIRSVKHIWIGPTDAVKFVK
jgi:hypothetical protein